MARHTYELEPWFRDEIASRPPFATWQEAEDWLHVPRFPECREDWPRWAWPHLTDAMIGRDQSLPFGLVFTALVERSGLPMPPRAVLSYLARRCAGDAGRHRRCWPPINTIGDRIGASRTAVRDALKLAESSGWLLIVRHARAPSDYLLDVPDLLSCPCAEHGNGTRTAVTDCVDDPFGTDRLPWLPNERLAGERSYPDCEGSAAVPQTIESRPAPGREPATHLVQALDSDSGFNHSPRIRAGQCATRAMQGSELITGAPFDETPNFDDESHSF